MAKKKMTVLDFKKYKEEGRKFAYVTAYDYTTASIVNESEVEVILVGDSLGMIMLGYDTTVGVNARRHDSPHPSRRQGRAQHLRRRRHALRQLSGEPRTGDTQRLPHAHGDELRLHQARGRKQDGPDHKAHGRRRHPRHGPHVVECVPILGIGAGPYVDSISAGPRRGACSASWPASWASASF